MPYILNLVRISPHGEAIDYRPYGSASFEVGSHVKTAILLLSLKSQLLVITL